MPHATKSLASLSRLALAPLVAALLADLAGAQRPARPRGPASGSFEIVSCSLGCTPVGPGLIGCGTTEIHENEEIRVTYSLPVDPTSLSPNSFRVIDVATGTAPPAILELDPDDPTTVVFRPLILFDSAGNPVFGLQPQRVYLLVLPGIQVDPVGPYVTSVDGHPSLSRLQCTLLTSLGVADASPGRPRGKIEVLTVLERDPQSGEPTLLARVPAAGATEVWRDSPIDFAFDDLMNPATLANPVTGTSSSLRVLFDPDGNVANASDQVLVPGRFTISLDTRRPRTQVRFQADGALPASGPGRGQGRIVVTVAAQVSDLAGNALLNPGTTVFTTEGL